MLDLYIDLVDGEGRRLLSFISPHICILPPSVANVNRTTVASNALYLSVDSQEIILRNLHRLLDVFLVSRLRKNSVSILLPDSRTMNFSNSSVENSPSTAPTSPEPHPSMSDDGIWGSDDDLTARHVGSGQGNRAALMSDLPSVKRQHMTDGYREGLSIGKAKVMQKGFDEGYPLGIRIGLRAGKVLGLLEGVVAAKGLSSDAKTQVEKLFNQARQELLVSHLMKDLNDELLMESSNIPANIENVLRKWELTVIGDISGKSESEGL